MRITLVSSCGLVLEAEGRTLLVDALNKQFRCYYGLPPETFAQMLAGEPPYDALCGILCTHAPSIRRYRTPAASTSTSPACTKIRISGCANTHTSREMSADNPVETSVASRKPLRIRCRCPAP